VGRRRTLLKLYDPKPHSENENYVWPTSQFRVYIVVG
jgi:hypothetical protein